MSDEEFVNNVRTMRLHQKEFFKAPYGSDEKREALIQSKIYEKIVDKEVERRRLLHETPALAL